MSEIEDKINQILSNPEALKQVQSLGRQLGLSGESPEPKPQAQLVQESDSSLLGDDTLATITRLAPVLRQMQSDDDTSRLLFALRPFLSEEKRHKLDNAEKMIKFIKIIPLLKDNGMFF